MLLFTSGSSAATLTVPRSGHAAHINSNSPGCSCFTLHPIGFVEFRTEEDASVAREVLRGAQVDIKNGAVLNAEVVKDLHAIHRAADFPRRMGFRDAPFGMPDPIGAAAESTIPEETSFVIPNFIFKTLADSAQSSPIPHLQQASSLAMSILTLIRVRTVSHYVSEFLY